ncbi:MAG: 30S ribosomal protein S3 [archaeon]|nr:30S ribosomal protein S3 [archaeon]
MASKAIRHQVSKKRKFVSDGIFYAELNEFLTRELSEDGYSGVEVRVTPARTEIIIRATRTRSVLGEKGQRIRELTAVVQKRFNFPDNYVELFAERVQNRALCAVAQAESLAFKLQAGLAVRRACYGIMRFVMEEGAKGCEVLVSGKLRGIRAKSMKFTDGYMIKTGNPVRQFVDSAVRHIKMRQGVLGVKVTIMLPSDPTGRSGPKNDLPDSVKVSLPKEEEAPVAKPASSRA